MAQPSTVTRTWMAWRAGWQGGWPATGADGSVLRRTRGQVGFAGGHARQAHLEMAAAIAGRLRLDAAALRAGGARRDGQAEPGAMPVIAEHAATERLEDHRQLGRRQADAVVAHVPHHLVAFAAHRHFDLAPVGVLDRVVDEVLHDRAGERRVLNQWR